MQTVFNGTKGLNNVSDPAHLPVGEGQTPYLTSSLNIAVGDTGRVNRLKGASLSSISPGENIHSLTSYNGSLVYAQNNTLCTLSLTGEEKQITSLSSSNPVYYHKLFTGRNEKLFWITPQDKGRIGSVNNTWRKADYYGPKTVRKFDEPPKGSICEYLLGRFWIAVGNVLYKSEPSNPYLFNYASGYFSFESSITFVAGFENGFWVGTQGALYYISSDGINFERKKVISYGCPFGKPVKVDLSDMPLQLQTTGIGYIVLTHEGFGLTLPGGYFFNLTKKNVTFKNMPSITSYAAIRSEQYIYAYANTGLGLVLNIRNLAVTQQNCYPFNSFAELDGEIYGANSNGIYRVTETITDASLSFWVNLQRVSRVRFLYLNGEFAGSLKVAVESDQRIIRTYIAEPREVGLKQHSFKIPIRRDNGIGTYWKITVENVDGVDFSIDRVELTTKQRKLYRGV